MLSVFGRRWAARGVREARLASGAAAPTPLPPTPPAPQPPPLEDVVAPLWPGGEQPFAEIGLGGWGPIGLVQYGLEYLHVSQHVPWWGAIVIGTVCVRLAMFPVVVFAQRHAARTHNHAPKIAELQDSLIEAKQLGDQLLTARCTQEMAIYMSKNGISPMKNTLAPLLQFPFFVSFFLALRGMAYCPVESMTYGGLFWFEDLTVPDQYRALPLITTGTVLLTIEHSLRTHTPTAKAAVVMRYVFRAAPFAMLPFMLNFPTGILCYWVSTNTITLFQSILLKVPTIRNFLNIPILAVHPPKPVEGGKKKGFIENAKDTWQGFKTTKDVEGRLRDDEILFNKAGKGALIKTYKYDPTKVMAAKAKDT